MTTNFSDEGNNPYCSPLVSNPGDVRVGPILAIPTVLSELGITPQRAFSRAGVDLGLFHDPDGRIAIEALGRLLESCVALTNCSHFGLLVGERFDLQGLGPLGYLMRNSATVGDALHSLLLHLHLHDRGAAPILLVPDSARVILGYSVYHHAARAIDQIYDGAIAIAYKILHELCGPSWSPLCVQFAHNPPQNMAPYRRLFRSRVKFDAEVSGIVLSPDWLQRPIENADATLHGILTKALQQTEANSPTSFAEQVQGVLHQMILSGNASAVSIAALFRISERTLRRRLEAEGKHLKQLVNEARFELARQLLSNTRLPVSEIAAALQFRDPNAFSRAFHGWATISPTQWRARQADSLD